MKFVLQGQVLTANKVYSTHYRLRAERVKYWRQLAAVVGANRRAEWQAGGPTEVVARPVTPGQRRQDTGAVMPTVKAVIDGLVDAGYWPDDSAQWIRKLSFLPQERNTDWREPGLELWLRPYNEVENAIRQSDRVNH